MGGQACVLYGAAEFSRDIDFAVMASVENLGRLGEALGALDAEVIAFPPFERVHLEGGHGVHFRARHPEAVGFRIDVLARMRGVDPFPELWRRRTTFELAGVGSVDALGLPDLVASKKTQRDKDWSMIRRLVEASLAGDGARPTPERIAFWLRELRSPELLIACAGQYGPEARAIGEERAAVRAALGQDLDAVRGELAAEEERERAVDREYWAPLRAELEQMRRGRERG